MKPDTVAWVGTHRHAKTGNELYVFCYLYKYGVVLPRGARTLTLPQNEKIKVLALTVAQNANDDALPVGPPRESVGWGE